MRLSSEVLENPNFRILRVREDIGDFDDDRPSEWQVELVSDPILSKSHTEGFFLVRGKLVPGSGPPSDCWLDLVLPERISETVFMAVDGEIPKTACHEIEIESICAVGIETFGGYELFYSRRAPELGLDVLRAAIKHAERQASFAEDMGYILRDEGRFAEAAASFQLSVNEGPSSYFIYRELADCYSKCGDPDQAAKYEQKFRAHGGIRGVSATRGDPGRAE